MYALRYTIPFVGNEIAEPIRYRVELWQRLEEGSATPEVVELDGAPSPFEFSLANDDDPMLPIRTSTAKISFVDDIDLVELLPADGFEWRVVLMNADDNTAVFTGYLTGEVFTQPFVEGPNIVTVNAVSATVPALATAMDIIGKGSLSIGQAIAQVARLSDSVERVYIPALYYVDDTSSVAHFTDLLRLRFSTWKYMRFADNSQLTGEQFECDNYQAVVSDICTLFGWSMTDVGDGSLYFVAPGYTGTYLQLAIAELEFDSIFTPRLVQPTILSSDDIEPIDASDSMEVRQGYSSVMITADAVDSQVQMADIKEMIKGWAYQRESVEVTIQQFTGIAVGTFTATAEVGRRVATIVEKNVVLPRYRCVATYDSNELLKDTRWEQVTDGTEDANADAFAQCVEVDSCPPSALTVEDGEVAKREWSFSQMFRVKEQAIIYRGAAGEYLFPILPEEYPLLKIIGSTGLLSGGAIVVDFDVRATPMDGYHIPEDFYIAGGDINGNEAGCVQGFTSEFWGKKKSFAASLKVGDMWWNGSRWIATESRFNIPISTTSGEWHSVLSNKTVDMPYSGSRGLYIPIANEVQGEVTFCLYPTLADIEEIADKPEDLFVYDGSRSPMVDIKGFAVSYAPRIDYVDVSSLSSTYYRDFGRSFPNQLDISLALHSRVNNATQLSLLYKESGQPLDTLSKGGAGVKPEQYLLETAERIYANIVRRWRRGMALQRVLPIVPWSYDGGSVLVSTGATINYAEGVGEVYLTEIKTM